LLYTSQDTINGVYQDYVNMIGFEQPKGNNSSYIFTDRDPLSIKRNLVYYRLRQKDWDGKTTFSKVAAVGRKQPLDFDFYPTLATDRLKIHTSISDYDILIYNVLGQLVHHPKQVTDINISDLPSGNYWLRFQTPKAAESAVKRFVKQCRFIRCFSPFDGQNTARY
jgi:Secretion system C-terminal sorting domain